jgi:hypothetical protein
MKRFSSQPNRFKDPWYWHHRANRNLQPATNIGYETLQLLGCVAFIAGLFWIYSMVLKGGV